MTKYGWIRLAVAAFIATLGFAAASASAEARTFAQAQGDAVYYSAVDCPHKSGGVCLRRDSQVIAGLGGGRWTIETRGWETGWWDLSRDWRNARWYYYRHCELSNGGSRSNCRQYGDW